MSIVAKDQRNRTGTWSIGTIAQSSLLWRSLPWHWLLSATLNPAGRLRSSRFFPRGLPTALKSGESGIFTTETRRHGEQQHLLKCRGMKEAIRLPILRKSGERMGHPRATFRAFRPRPRHAKTARAEAPDPRLQGGVLANIFSGKA